MKQPKVSVYIPVYGVEKYIEKCAQTLFEQTLDDLEYVFVDDCTPDNSFQILEQVLEKYPNRKSQVKIVHHKINQGVCIARKTGIQHCTGKYIACCEPDDWVETAMYEELYNKAKETGADMVDCDYFLETSRGTTQAIGHYEGSLVNLMSHWLNREYPTYIWSKLIKKEIYKAHNIYFPDKNDGSYSEDAVLICQLLSFIQSYSFVKKPFYHYRILPNSISHDVSNFRKRTMSLISKYTWIDHFIQQQYGKKYTQDILMRKLSFKLSWLLGGLNDEFYKYWPEANKVAILHKLPIPVSNKIILWLAIHQYEWTFKSIIHIYKFFKIHINRFRVL